MAGIDRQISDRMMMGEQALQQRYAQSQELIDLLALQALSKEKEEKARAIQASMQSNPATVKDQLEQKNLAANRQGIASMMPGVQMQGQRMQQAQARPAGGIPTQPAPNMARMAKGGIVAFQEGGMADTSVQEYVRLSEKLKDPNITPEAAQAINMMLEDMRRQAQDPSRFMLDVERARGFDPAAEYERSMQEQGMYGGGEVSRYQTGDLVTLDEYVPTHDEEGNPIRLDENGNIITVGPEGDLGGLPRGDFRFIYDILKRVPSAVASSMAKSGQIAGEASLGSAASVLPPDSEAGRAVREQIRQVEARRPSAVTPAVTPTEVSDEDVQAFFDALETPPNKKPEPEEKRKREIDWDLLREMGAGMAGQTSIANALGGGARAVGEELRRRETMASEEAQQAADRNLKMLLAQYDLQMADRKILADYSNILTEAQLEVAADTLDKIDSGMYGPYNDAVAELEDEYEGEILVKKIAQLKRDIVNKAVSNVTSLGGAPTTGSQQFSSFDTVGS